MENTSVDRAELAAQAKSLRQLEGPLGEAQAKVNDKPPVIAFTEWAAGMVSSVFSDAMSGMVSGAEASQRLVSELATQVEHAKDAYEKTEEQAIKAAESIVTALGED